MRRVLPANGRRYYILEEIQDGQSWKAFVVGKFASGGFAAFAGKASPTLIKGLLNFAFLNVTARGIGVADQVLVEGMLRNGKNISDTGEEAFGGATMFEQPFINIFNRTKSGYYTGCYAKDADGNDIEEAHNGHGAGAAITDTYYAMLSAVSMGLMAKASATHENIAKESIAAAKETIAKAMEGGKKFLFERTKKSSGTTLSSDAIKHSNEGDFANPANPKISTEPGKMQGGGHGQDNIKLLDKLGRQYNIVKEFKNGVRLGNVEKHAQKMKRTGTGQTWFPENWTEKDIENAGNHVIDNTPDFESVPDGPPGVFGEYKGVQCWRL